MLRFGTTLSHELIEQALAELPERFHETLQLPNSLKADPFGGEAALCQFIMSWARKNDDNSRLRTHGLTADDRAMKNFATTAYGLIALNFADHLENVSGDTLSRYDALSEARDIVLAMHDGDTRAIREYRKTIVPFLCIDNAKHFSRPRVFYKTDGKTPRGRVEFRNFLHGVVREITPRDLWEPTEDLIVNAGRALYEAFVNTDDHARRDLHGNPFFRSVRGILVAHRTIKKTVAADAVRWSNPLTEYFESYRTFSDKENIHLLELSIIDSGPGIAATWLNKQRGGNLHSELADVSLNDELSALLECMKKGRTSESIYDRGFGLYRIMDSIKKEHGFMKVRSGRLALLSVFDRAGEDDLLLSLSDLETGGAPRRYGYAYGSLLTVILPLNRKK